MNKNEKMALVPRLRFPEFRDTAEWLEKPLGNVTYPVSRKNSEKKEYPIYSINNKKGFLPQSEQFDGVDSTSRGYDISLYKVVDKKTFAYNPARINVGSIGYSGELFDIIISSLYVCFKSNEEVEDSFLRYFWETSIFKREVENHVEGGIRSYLFYENFSRILLCFPEKKEQRKIADCLSSLDDLIAAEDKKLELLKTHKKGLMQKLFPAEGETVPEWRFPEFRGSAKWEEKKFGELCDFTRGPFGGALKKEIFIKNGYAVYEQSHAIYSDFDTFRYYITKEKYNELKRFSVHANDIIMSCSGTMGKFAIVPKGVCEGVINQALLKLTIKNGIDVKFAKTTFELDSNQKKLLSQSSGGAIKNIVSVAQMKEIRFLIPHFSEQQKIADCLSSIDDLIAEQAKKIETLKTHKKGLMQGLYPSIEEVSK